MPEGRLFRRAAGTVALVVLALLPFIAYFAYQSSRSEGPPPWPSNVALAATADKELKDFAILGLEGPTVVVTLPIETLLKLPGAGRVRALTAFKIGGPERLAEALEETVDIRVPYSVEGSTDSALRSFEGLGNHNLGSHAGEVQGHLTNALEGRVPIVPAPGSVTNEGGTTVFELDVAALRRTLRSPPSTTIAPPSPSPLPSPLPSPSPAVSPSATSQVDRSSVRVEVLNAGAAEGAAGKVGESLTSAGFRVIRIADHAGDDVEGTIVYYRTSRAEGEEVARVLGGGARVEALPSDTQTVAAVRVLVGRPS